MKALILVLFVLVFMYTLPEIQALTREDIDLMKVSIEDIRKELLILNADHIIIEDDLIEEESNLKDQKALAKNSKIWNDYAETVESREDLRVANDKVRETEKTLRDLESEKQSSINEILSKENTMNQLQIQVDRAEDIIQENARIEKQGLTRVIGIDLSKTCKILLMNNYDTDCPTYNLLEQMDSSLPQSGEFDYIDGLYQRGKPLVHNDHRLYDYDEDFKIIVDPSPSLRQNIRMITIENNFDTYKTKIDNIKSNNTRTLHHDRYVESCFSATINSAKWLPTLYDTIYYLRSGCDGSTIETLETIVDEKTEIDITTSPSYQYRLWLEEAKERCKVRC